MQDKRIHIDEKFTDQGWSEMAKLLDKEMPVKTGNGRRLAWWTWAIIAGLVVGGLASFLFILSGESVAPDVKQMPVALNDSSISQPSQENEVLISNGIKSESAPSEETQKKESNSTPQSQLTMAVSKGSSQRFSNAKTTEIFGDLASQKLPILSQQAEVFAASESKNIENPTQGNQNFSNDFSNLKREKLAKLESNTGLKELSAGFPSLSVITHFPKMRTWDWSLQASGLSSINLKGLGLSTELTATKSLFKDGLAFEIGAGYKYLRQPIYEIVEQGANFEADGQDIVYANSSFKASFDTQSTGSITKYRKSSQLHLHYLELPVKISYQFGKRIDAHAGLTTSFLLASRTNQSSDGILSNLASNGTLVRSVNSASSLSLHEFAATGGVGFALTKKASILLDFNYGLTDVIPNNGVEDFNRMLKLGFRYRLNARN